MAAIRIARAPPGFPERPEFQPRAPAGPGRPERVWLPAAPSFSTSETEQARPPPASPWALASRERARLARESARRWGVGVSPAAEARLSTLEAPEGRLVVTGQQPGLLTGPLYTVLKAAGAAAAARRLQARTGAPHAPLFWVASEDHDLDEARAIRFPATPGPGTLELALPHAADRRPLSAYPVDRRVEEVLEKVAEHLAGRRHGALARELVDLYRGGTLASGFARLLARLLAGQGLLVLDPEALRPSAAPLLERCLREPEELLERIREGAARLEGRGVAPPVPARFPLFLLEDGKRQHLEPRGGPGGEWAFEVEGTGRALARAEVLRLLEREPGRFSPGVLLRPLVQNALLPNSVYLGGAMELCYFAQLGPLFEWFGLESPRIAVRPSATLIEGKVARAMRRLGLLPGDPGAAERWARAVGPEDLCPPLPGGPQERLEALAGEALPRLREALADPRLPAPRRGRLEAAAEKVAADIRALGVRAGRAVRQSQEEELAAAARVHASFFPEGTLQERRWNILHFVSKYGLDWLDELVEALASEPREAGHDWVFFEEAAGQGEEA